MSKGMELEEAIDIIDKELHKKWDKSVEKKTKKIVTKTKVLYKGFVFTKKQAQTEAANIILNNPTYYISHNYPILKAESEIGKCYILGFKNNKLN